MQSRNTLSLLTLLLSTAAACAYQNAGAGVDDGNGTAAGGTASGGTAAGGTASKAGSSSISVSGTTSSVTTAGKTSSSGGTGSDLPPIGSAGKGGSGGSAGKGGSGGKGGSAGKAGSAGTGGGAGGEDTGPVNMPIVGLSVTFMAASTSDPSDFLGGELDVINDTAQPLSLADLKIRYYFSNEITAVMPSVMMNWAQFGPKNNLGGATCTGTVNKADTPVMGADSYVELTCSGASSSELTAGTLLKASWKAGAQGMGKFVQSNDWSFTDPTKIVILNGNTIVWGVEPS